MEPMPQAVTEILALPWLATAATPQGGSSQQPVGAATRRAIWLPPPRHQRLLVTRWCSDATSLNKNCLAVQRRDEVERDVERVALDHRPPPVAVRVEPAVQHLPREPPLERAAPLAARRRLACELRLALAARRHGARGADAGGADAGGAGAGRPSTYVECTRGGARGRDANNRSDAPRHRTPSYVWRTRKGHDSPRRAASSRPFFRKASAEEGSDAPWRRSRWS